MQAILHVFRVQCTDDLCTDDLFSGCRDISMYHVTTIMSDRWAKFVDPHFAEVVEKLQSSLILDHLRGECLVTREEYSDLQKATYTELQRARILVNDLLPRKGKDSLDKFCRILLKIPGQEHIVEDIIQYEPTSETSRQDETQRDACAVSGVSSSSKGNGPKLATFCFTEQHKEFIEPVESLIRSMCHKFFGINKEDVEFVFDDKPDKNGYLCYCDLQGKLAVLIVQGVSPIRVRLHRERLIGCIVALLKQHKVEHREVHFVETRPGSAFIVLSMGIDTFIGLLCLLGQEDQSGAKEFGIALQRAIPGLQKGNLYLGGLPAVELFNSPLNQSPFSLEQTRTICMTLSRKVLVIAPLCVKCDDSLLLSVDVN